MPRMRDDRWCPAAEELRATERSDPRGHAMHVCIAVAWALLQSITNAGEGIAWALLLAISAARLPRIWRCYRLVWRDPLWWTMVSWGTWWALAGLWGPEMPGQTRAFLPERWLLTPLMLWPVMGRPLLVLGAMGVGGVLQSAAIVMLSWNGAGWDVKSAARGLSALSQSQWQTMTALVLSVCAIRFGSRPTRASGIVALACSTLGVLVLAVRTMTVAALVAVPLALGRAGGRTRPRLVGPVALAASALAVAAGLLAWSPAGVMLRDSLSNASRAAVAGNDLEAALDASGSRLVLAEAAVSIGREHPVLGGGRGTFMARLPSWTLARIAADPSLEASLGPMLEGTLTDAHNALLQAWVDGGIPAAVLLASMLVGLAVRLWRQSRSSALACTALALHLIVLVNVPGGIIIAKSPGALIAVCLSISWLGLGYRVANPITAPGALPRSRLSALYM